MDDLGVAHFGNHHMKNTSWRAEWDSSQEDFGDFSKRSNHRDISEILYKYILNYIASICSASFCFDSLIDQSSIIRKCIEIRWNKYLLVWSLINMLVILNHHPKKNEQRSLWHQVSELWFPIMATVGGEGSDCKATGLRNSAVTDATRAQ